MRKIFYSFLVLIATATFSFAQEFTVAWKTKFTINPNSWYYDDDAKYVLGRNEGFAELLDGSTGKPIWKLDFKKDLGIKKLERAVYNVEAGIALFYNGDEKDKQGEKVIIDWTTGKQLWRADQYSGADADQNWHFPFCVSNLCVPGKNTTVFFDNKTKKFTGIDVRTGEKKWESKEYSGKDLSKNITLTYHKENPDYALFIDLVDIDISYINILTGKMIDLSDVPAKENQGEIDANAEATSISSNFYRNGAVIRNTGKNLNVKLTAKMKTVSVDKIEFTLNSFSPNSWEKKYEGIAVRQLYTEAPYIRMTVTGGKIYVMSKKIEVFDLSNGNKLWEAPFDNCDASAGLKAKQEFGIAGWPVSDESSIYYIDLKTDNCIKKADASTGKVLWKSEAFKSSDRIPDMIVSNDVLIAQFGGMINVQKYIPNSEGGGTYKMENKFDGKFGIRAYNPSTGATLWTTENLADKLGDKFGTRVTNMVMHKNNLLVSSGENLFCLNPKTGDVVFKTNLSASKIGEAFEIKMSPTNDALYIFCDKGVAAINPADGKLQYTTKTDQLFWEFPGSQSYAFTQGNNFFLWVGEKDFIGFDLKSGKIKGKMKDNSNPQLTADGNYVLIRDGSDISKFAINGK